MRQGLFLFIILLSAQFMSGCATIQKTRGPSDFLLSTDRSTKDVITVLKSKLSESKYKMAKEDTTTGLLVFEPRGFSYEKNGKKIKAKQTVHAQHEGGSVKMHIIYICDYSGKGDIYKPCLEDDSALDDKIDRIENAIIESVKNLLLKHGSS